MIATNGNALVRDPRASAGPSAQLFGAAAGVGATRACSPAYDSTMSTSHRAAPAFVLLGSVILGACGGSTEPPRTSVVPPTSVAPPSSVEPSETAATTVAIEGTVNEHGLRLVVIGAPRATLDPRYAGLLPPAPSTDGSDPTASLPPGPSVAMIVRLENTTDATRWLHTELDNVDWLSIDLSGPGAISVGRPVACTDELRLGRWVAIAAHDHLDFPIEPLESNPSRCARTSFFWTTPGTYSVVATLVGAMSDVEPGPALEVPAASRLASASFPIVVAAD